MPGSAVSDLAGRVLAGRYLLHGAIGTGASGRVYAADDTRLRRRVAVKVLHAALAEDAAFLRRFRAEAQLAASLHHPHIVTVHDWGEDDMPFMVLELLEGGSLRAMLDRGTQLSVAQAARIGRDVASALHYAHSAGVLHRDIKPANLLFDEHGIVRVADFGLARALAEASWTEPVGAVFGTARYASPEQARGVKLDGRSDLYSLALVLVEAVTGDLPFGADTTIGLLTARTQEPLVAPESLGPLAAVVDRAGAIDPEDRYPNAATMRAALAAAAESTPPPAPLALAGAINRPDAHPTRAAPPRDPRNPLLFDQDAADMPTAPPTVHPTQKLPIVGGPPLTTTQPVPPTQPAKKAPKKAPKPTAIAPKQPDGEGGGRNPRRLVPFVVGLVLLVTVAIATAALARVSGSAPIPVPNLIGLTQADAMARARTTDGLVARVGPQRAAPDPAGVVIDQEPSPGEMTTGGRVTLIVSSGPAPLAIPNIVGKPWKQGKATLDKNGWLLDGGAPKREYSDTVAKDVVIRVSPPPGQPVPPETPLAVVVSDGRAPVVVPDLSDESYEDAKAELEELKFTVPPPIEDFHDAVKKGDVIGTDPGVGTQAPYGSEVKVHVSKGRDLVTVPNLINRDLDEATERAEDNGLVLEVDGRFNDNWEVAAQDPCPGDRVKRGSTVTVELDRNGSIFGGDFCF
jgi:serine/threonine-protein kinase